MLYRRLIRVRISLSQVRLVRNRMTLSKFYINLLELMMKLYLFKAFKVNKMNVINKVKNNSFQITDFRYLDKNNYNI